jgi:hypothetical protein
VQKTLGIVVEQIRLKIENGQVGVFVITDGIERVLWLTSTKKDFDEKVGAIAIKFSPLAPQKR